MGKGASSRLTTRTLNKENSRAGTLRFLPTCDYDAQQRNLSQSTRRRELFGDLALQFKRPPRQLGIMRFDEEGIESAAMIDAAERVGGNPKSYRAAERVRN